MDNKALERILINLTYELHQHAVILWQLIDKVEALEQSLPQHLREVYKATLDRLRQASALRHQSDHELHEEFLASISQLRE